MSKWKCEICGSEFENFHAQVFDSKIYCPLCYFKKKNQELKKQLKPDYYVKGLEGTLKEYQQEMNKIVIQQKEFIKWLESIKFVGIIPVEMVFDKYKEIIGDDK